MPENPTPEPLLLIPGLLCDEALWAPQIAHFGQSRTIIVAKPFHHDRIAAMAGDILDRAPSRFAVAGLSMGGYLALELYRQAPQRLTRLALLNSSAHPDTAEQTAVRQDFIALAAKGRFLGVSRTMLPLLIHPDRLDDHHLTEGIMAMSRRVGREVFIRQETAVMHREDSRPLLPRIAIPTLVIAGRQDRMISLAWQTELARAIPDAALVNLDRCGHLSTLEQPQPVNDALEAWLSRPAPDRRS